MKKLMIIGHKAYPERIGGTEIAHFELMKRLVKKYIVGLSVESSNDITNTREIRRIRFFPRKNQKT